MGTMAIVIGLSEYAKDVNIAGFVDMYESWEQRLLLNHLNIYLA
jgi:hypothetical protein